MEWSRRATDIELAQIKLIYAAIYMILEIIPTDLTVNTRPTAPHHESSEPVSAPVPSNDEFETPEAFKTPKYLKISHAKRFQPVEKLLSVGRKQLRNISVEQCRDKFRWLCRDNSDKFVLRYVRQMGDSRKIIAAICETIAWHIVECDTQELLRRGESYYVFKEPNERYMKQFEVGKRTLVGQDKMGRPINILTARRHLSRAQSTRDLEQFSLFMFEQTFLSMQDTTDGCIIIFDMQGFKSKNMDFKIAKFIIEKFNTLYPMMMIKLFVYKAPRVFRTAYTILKPWFDPCIVDRVKFIDTNDELLAMIPASQLPTVLGGHSKHQYEWIPPRLEDDAPMLDTETASYLKQQRLSILKRLESTTTEWITQKNSVRLAGLEHERRFLLDQLKHSYWQLDPYVRSRTIFDRNGKFGQFRPELAPGGIGQPVCKPQETCRNITAPLSPTNHSYSLESECESNCEREHEPAIITPSPSDYNLHDNKERDSSLLSYHHRQLNAQSTEDVVVVLPEKTPVSPSSPKRPTVRMDAFRRTSATSATAH